MTARRSTWLRIGGALVVASHAAIHIVGFLRLWRIAEPGEFTYDTATPAAGSLPAKIVGVAWPAAAILFLATAVQLLRRAGRWQPPAVAACVVSIPALVIDAGDTFAGVIVNGVILAAAVVTARQPPATLETAR